MWKHWLYHRLYYIEKFTNGHSALRKLKIERVIVIRI